MLTPAPSLVPSSRTATPVLPEGADGLFSQSWFPICLASDVAKGKVKGFDFLDGRVVIWRGEDGEAQVTSAFCPHMGASLEAGNIVGNRIRCSFHHWEYASNGACEKTAIGDVPPKAACLFVFPSIEKYGLVWAFSGEEPLYELPTFSYPHDRILMKTIDLPDTMPVDPWMQYANTPDIQHIKTLHRVTFDAEPEGKIEWGAFDMQHNFEGQDDTGSRVAWRVGVFGPALYYQSSDLEGRWFGFLVPMGLVRPGVTRIFMVLAVRKTDDAKVDRDFLEHCLLTEIGIVGEDTHIMTSMKFRPETLTKPDRVLGQYFDFLRNDPRAHPSAAFIK